MKFYKTPKRILAFLCALLLLVPYVTVMTGWNNVYATTQTGKVNDDVVNVRVGAGTTNDYLRDSAGKKIQLSRNHEVTILGSANASDGSLWYQINFYYSGAAHTGYMHSAYINIINNVEYTEDADFESYLTAQGFPESYKNALRNLHTQYPKWTFVADHLNYDWEDAVNNQSIVGRSLVQNTSISSWKSTDVGAYDYNTGTWYGFDGSAWVAASREMVAYSMDPRNFLDSSSVFQFEKLAYDSNTHILSGVESTVQGTFMDNVHISDDNGGSITYSQAILNAAMITGVSPYHLASRIVQEMGATGGSGSISGAYPGYEGLYNYFNQGAYAHDGRSAVVNGLRYARNQGWTTRYRSICGGASHIGSSYINAGQNTLYYEKFDYIGTPYTHQYMTNIQAPDSEAVTVAKGYSEEMRKSLNLVFVIPVFKNMPEVACPKPTGDGSPNNVLSTLKINDYSLTPTFSKFVYEYDLIVSKDVSEIKITTETLDPSATVKGAGKVALVEGSNTIIIAVTAPNGDVRNYTINIFRGESSDTTTTTPENSETTTVTPEVVPGEVEGTFTVTTEKFVVDETNAIVTGVNPGTKAIDMLGAMTPSEGELYVLKSDGTINDGTVSTGNQLLLVNAEGKEAKRYNIVVYGDVDGDGLVSSMDLLYIKRHILGIKSLDGLYLLAGDSDRKNDGVTSTDLLYVKRHVLEISTIQQ